MADDDWRLGDQERYLLGAILSWKPYRAPSETWNHDHCEFCWAKFMEPRTAEAAGMTDVLTEGYTTTAEHEQGAEYHWICKPCFDDFADRFDWKVRAEGSDPIPPSRV